MTGLYNTVISMTNESDRPAVLCDHSALCSSRDTVTGCMENETDDVN